MRDNCYGVVIYWPFWCARDTHVVSCSYDAHCCLDESWLLWFWPSSTFWRITIVVSFDAHSLDEFWTLDQNNWTLPAHRLKMKVFSKRKETPTSRLKGVNEGLSPLYLRCLGIETRHVHHQQGSTQKHTNQRSSFYYRHPPPNLCLSKRLGEVGINMQASHFMSDSEWMSDNKDFFKTDILNALRFSFKNKQIFTW